MCILLSPKFVWLILSCFELKVIESKLYKLVFSGHYKCIENYRINSKTLRSSMKEKHNDSLPDNITLNNGKTIAKIIEYCWKVIGSFM
jgi:hypothetical protein